MIFNGGLPGEGFFPDADAQFLFALFQNAGKLEEIRGVLFPDGRSEFNVKLFGERDLLLADLFRTAELLSAYVNDERKAEVVREGLVRRFNDLLQLMGYVFQGLLVADLDGPGLPGTGGDELTVFQPAVGISKC